MAAFTGLSFSMFSDLLKGLASQGSQDQPSWGQSANDDDNAMQPAAPAPTQGPAAPPSFMQRAASAAKAQPQMQPWQAPQSPSLLQAPVQQIQGSGIQGVNPQAVASILANQRAMAQPRPNTFQPPQGLLPRGY